MARLTLTSIPAYSAHTAEKTAAGIGILNSPRRTAPLKQALFYRLKSLNDRLRGAAFALAGTLGRRYANSAQPVAILFGIRWGRLKNNKSKEPS